MIGRIRTALTALSLATAVLLAGPEVIGASPASAQACLSQSDVRAAVDSGRAIPLSSVLGQIRATVGGEVLSSSLCDYGGQLVYLVNVLSGGQVTRLTVDAQSGAISY
jgi:uncharacterized membrane protein YkoI